MPTTQLQEVSLQGQQVGYTCFLKCAELILAAQGKTFPFPQANRIIATETAGRGDIRAAILKVWSDTTQAPEATVRRALQAEMALVVPPAKLTGVRAAWAEKERYWANPGAYQRGSTEAKAANVTLTEASAGFTQDMFLKACGFSKVVVEQAAFRSGAIELSGKPTLIMGKLWNAKKAGDEHTTELCGRAIKYFNTSKFSETGGHALVLSGVFFDGEAWRYLFRDPNHAGYWKSKQCEKFPDVEVWRA